MLPKFDVWAKIAGAALLVSIVSGCSGEEQGYAEPETSASDSPEYTSTTSSTPALSVSSSIDPCDLLLAEDLAEVGEFESTYKEQGGARSCHWQKSAKGGGDGFAFAVSVRDSQSIETVNDNGSGIHEDEVNQRPSVWTVDTQFDDCTFAMKIDEMSRVDVTVPGDPDSNDSCEVAKVIAGMIEPNLPEIP
jgi:hypothetical protein